VKEMADIKIDHLHPGAGGGTAASEEGRAEGVGLSDLFGKKSSALGPIGVLSAEYTAFVLCVRLTRNKCSTIPTGGASITSSLTVPSNKSTG
jgi:hypothetical protein